MKGYLAAVCSLIALVALIGVSNMSHAQSGPNGRGYDSLDIATHKTAGRLSKGEL